MAASDIQQLRAAVVTTFREAAATGMTARQKQLAMQRAITETVEGNLNSWKFIDRSGRNWKNGNFFNMLNRTTVANVTRDAYVDGLIDNGHDLATIEGGGDPCPVCSAWRGVIVSVSGTSKKFPSNADAEAAGVFHPNCVCEYAFVDETIDKKLIKDQTDIPNPETPNTETWNKYARDIHNAKKERVGITEKPQALVKSNKLDKRLKKDPGMVPTDLKEPDKKDK